MHRTAILVTILFLIGFSFLPAWAEEKEAAPFEISGFVDTYYSYNFNNPQSGLNKLSNFDFYHNDFNINLAEVVISRTAAPVGFRIDLDFGPTADFVAGCAGANCDVSPSPDSPYRNIQQAYVSWATPIGLNLDFGKFVTHMGAEVIESKDNWNYTRGLLFCCAIPFYHAGIRANYAINDMLFVNAYLYNGWNNVVENNTNKTFGAQIGITPIPQMPIILGWVGPEKGPGFTDRQVYEAIVTFNATDSLSFMADYNYGMQDAVGGGPNLKWSGIAAYARWKMDPCAVALRYEYMDDDGFTFNGVVQEVTVTAEHTIAKNLLTRVEYRHDFSQVDTFFEDKDGTFNKDSQGRIVVGLVYMF